MIKIKQTMVLIVLLLFFIQGNLFSKETKKSRIKNSTELDITYIIPGIRQIKTGYYFKGTLLLTSFLASIAGAIIENKKGNDYYNIYINSKNIDEIIDSRLAAENHFKKRNYYIMGGFSVWLINLIDLKFFSKNKGIKGEIKKDYIAFGFYYIF